MENMTLTFAKEKQTIFIVALFLLFFAIVMSYAMFKTTGYILMKTTRLATASVISSREEELYLSVSRTDFRHHHGIYSIYNGRI